MITTAFLGVKFPRLFVPWKVLYICWHSHFLFHGNTQKDSRFASDPVWHTERKYDARREERRMNLWGSCTNTSPGNRKLKRFNNNIKGWQPLALISRLILLRKAVVLADRNQCWINLYPSFQLAGLCCSCSMTSSYKSFINDHIADTTNQKNQLVVGDTEQVRAGDWVSTINWTWRGREWLNSLTWVHQSRH